MSGACCVLPPLKAYFRSLPRQFMNEVRSTNIYLSHEIPDRSQLSTFWKRSDSLGCSTQLVYAAKGLYMDLYFSDRFWKEFDRLEGSDGK